MPQTASHSGVLICVDGSAASDAAVAWGAREAVMRRLPITLMHAVPPVIVGWPAGQLYVAMPKWQKDNGQHVTDQARKVLRASVGESEPPEIRTEMVYPDSNAPVLLGIDGSPASEAATALAFDEASRRGVGLLALHVWSDVGVFPVFGMDWRDREREGQEILAERLAGWQERYPDVPVERLLFCDKPSQWLLKESERAQLVVVGSHGRGGFPGMLMGSVSSAVAHAAQVPVIVVRNGYGEGGNR
ncbi:universal stress protein [Mycobacterium sp.]|uniref:universal stress protein n=1 Tax=Mycobacterium sp. TaxID=1785 RepID=UPI0025F0914B|nr:universal stress protein [Mycobacterium sp.]MBW0011732.1 universal stress protein [Mycobacterium sp.]